MDALRLGVYDDVFVFAWLRKIGALAENFEELAGAERRIRGMGAHIQKYPGWPGFPVLGRAPPAASGGTSATASRETVPDVRLLREKLSAEGRKRKASGRSMVTGGALSLRRRLQ